MKNLEMLILTVIAIPVAYLIVVWWWLMFILLG